MKHKSWTKNMFKTEIDGQEGYFLTKEEHQQLKTFFSKAENIKVIHNADNS